MIHVILMVQAFEALGFVDGNVNSCFNILRMEVFMLILLADMTVSISHGTALYLFIML